MAGLLWAGDHILRRVVLCNILHSAGFSRAGQLFLTPAAHRWQVANEYVLYNVQLQCCGGSLRVTESCIPALVLHGHPSHARGHHSDLCMHLAECAPGGMGSLWGLAAPACLTPFLLGELQSQARSILFENTVGSDCSHLPIDVTAELETYWHFKKALSVEAGGIVTPVLQFSFKVL